ncbi:MAG: serine/threonine-protein kinase [Pseudomonadota bacterium]
MLGKYRIDRPLGRGAMGQVFAATHLGLGQLVAIKLLHPEALEDSDAVVRFLREAQLAAKIQSQHVARVMDVGHLEGGAPYIVMEYLDGEDLATVVARGPLPVVQAVDYVVQACDAMIEAHLAGIVHRDLKPSNLFLASRGDRSPIVKVLDFGVSKQIHSQFEGVGLTSTTTKLGSPAYMSPEQIRSARDVDARSDVWAIGVILFELLTGKRPFVAISMADLIPRIVNSAPPSLSELRPEVPARLEAAVLRCLQKQRADRFQNLSALVVEIAHFGTPRSLQIAERALQHGALPQQAASESEKNAASAAVAAVAAPATLSPPSERARKLRNVALLVLAVVLAIGLAALFTALNR